MTTKEEYKIRRNEVNMKLDMVKHILERKDKQFEKDPDNWNFVRDIILIGKILNEIINLRNQENI
jgi:hypothetical protein